MIIKIVSKQIPYFWNAIKYTVKEAGEVNEKDFQPYCNELLQALLSDKAQCFVRLDDKRILEAVLITRIMENRQALKLIEKIQKELFKDNFEVSEIVTDLKKLREITLELNNPVMRAHRT